MRNPEPTTLASASGGLLLLTASADLAALVQAALPDVAVQTALRCPAPAPERPVWVDADMLSASAAAPDFGAAPTYLYARLPDHHERLPAGLWVRRPCSPAALRRAWQVSASAEGGSAALGASAASRPLPGWVMEFHLQELDRLTRRLVERLPPLLGLRCVSLYLLDPLAGALRLAAESGRSPAGAEPPGTRPGEPRHALELELRSFGCLIGILRGEWISPGEVPDGLAEFLGRALQFAGAYHDARHEARIDALTGLFNYRWLRETLEREVRRSQRFGGALSMLLLDVDGLKQVNDTCGHAAGDAALRHVAGKIRAALRQVDSAARCGGDEFVVLLPSTEHAGAQQVAERLRQSVRQEPPAGCEAGVLDVSIGVAQWQAGWSVDRFLAEADTRMYHQKQSHERRRSGPPRRRDEPGRVARRRR